MTENFLPSRDYRKILEIINIIYSLTDRTAVFQILCEELQRLIPFDGAAFIPLDPRTSQFSIDGHMLFNSPAKTLPIFCEDFGALHPLIFKGFHTQHFNKALRITDALPASSLAKTEYSRHFQSMVPMFYELCALGVSQGDLMAGLCFHRTKQERDFTEFHKTILSVLMPHVSLALHNISLMEKIASSENMGLIILGEDGRPIYLTEEAKNTFDRNPMGKTPNPGIFSEPAFIRNNKRTFRVRTVQKLGQESVIFLENVPPAEDLRMKLRRFGLTPRQEEIALLVMEGLSNDEIADRLCIARQTAKDHIQDIFQKTDVHQRIELAAKIMGLRSED